MDHIQLMGLGFAVAVIGGAIAAKLTKIELWKGVLVAAVAALAAVSAYFVPGFDRSLAMPLAALVGAGVSGAVLGLSAPMTANILIGAAVPPMLGFVLMEMGGV